MSYGKNFQEILRDLELEFGDVVDSNEELKGMVALLEAEIESLECEKRKLESTLESQSSYIEVLESQVAELECNLQEYINN